MANYQEEKMKVAAIISEFNPFHNGHFHLISQIRSRIDDLAVVAIMSGDFVERGDTSIIGKYSRAEAAVKCGCDLVLELAAPWCFSGAEFFARGGVAIANSLGCVDYLAFGSECSDIAKLRLAAERIASEEFRGALKHLREQDLQSGHAQLREIAYNSLYGEDDLLRGSNNLLAIEYIRALNSLGSKIEPICVQRIGGAYGDTTLEGISSATAIRAGITRGENVESYMPTESASILRRELEAGRTYSLSRLDNAVIAMLRTAEPEDLREIMEISGGVENLLIKSARTERTIEGLVDSCAQRRYSKSRLRRAIISAMLGVKMSDAEAAPRFTQLLAANSKGREVLAMARKTASITILSKESAHHSLDGEAARQYSLHAKAESLCELACNGLACKGIACKGIACKGEPEKRKPFLTS